MALTSRERQARWREAHPEQAAARLLRLRESKQAAREARQCQHDPRRLRQAADGEIPVWVCFDCGGVFYIGRALDDYRAAHGIRCP